MVFPLFEQAGGYDIQVPIVVEVPCDSPVDAIETSHVVVNKF